MVQFLFLANLIAWHYEEKNNKVRHTVWCGALEQKNEHVLYAVGFIVCLFRAFSTSGMVLGASLCSCRVNVQFIRDTN